MPDSLIEYFVGSETLFFGLATVTFGVPGSFMSVDPTLVIGSDARISDIMTDRGTKNWGREGS